MKRYNIQHGDYSEYCIVYLKDGKKIHLKHSHHEGKFLTIYMDLYIWTHIYIYITRLTVVIIYQYTQTYKHYVEHSKKYNVSIKKF